MKVTRVVNNNVILATNDDPAGTRSEGGDGGGGDEIVLMGCGLGFKAHPGDEVEASRVERTFRPCGGQTPERIALFLDEIPAEHLAVTEEIVRVGRETLGSHIDRHMLIPLADHISFAVRRAEEGITIAYPLRGEVLQFYPQEVAFSRRAIAIVREHLGVRLPDLEAIPFALHFVNAQFNAADLRQVVKLTETFSLILGMIGTSYGMDVDEDSLDVARFITHLRYLALRQERGEVRPEGLGPLHEAFRLSNPREVACAEQIGQTLRDRYDWTIGPDQVLYLALHIGRLAGAAS